MEVHGIRASEPPHAEETLVARSKEECRSAYLPQSFLAPTLEQNGSTKSSKRRDSREGSLRP